MAIYEPHESPNGRRRLQLRSPMNLEPIGNLDCATREAAAAIVAEEEAAVENRRLDLEFTQVRAPVDGYVTNLNLRLGSQAVANQPALALVDINSFWVHGYFLETVI
jgi:multidrug resistance efflux pump